MSNFEPSTSQRERVPIAGTDAPSVAVNTTTKAELLGRAKAAIEAGEQSLNDAAEALGLAQQDHSATQREMAEAVGKSASWVNKLLKWRRSGYKDHSPFGPTTKRERVEHAQQRAKPSKPRKLRKDSEERQTNADDPRSSADKRKAENARLFSEPETEAVAEAEAEAKTKTETHVEDVTSTGAQRSTPRKRSPTEAKAELKYAIDQWWPQLDDEGKVEIAAHVSKKLGAHAS